jgi:urease accessory protein
MTIVEHIHTAGADAGPTHYDTDTLTLGWDDRRQGHGKRRSDRGIEFAISLPPGTILKEGDRLLLEPEQTLVTVREAPEPVYVVRPATPQDWAYYAYHVGNRHQQVMITRTDLVFLQSPAVRSLLEQLGVRFDLDRRPFTAALAAVGHSH